MAHTLRYGALGLVALSACSSKSDVPSTTAEGKAARYQFASGKTVDCAELKALPPGQVLTFMSRLTTDPADGQAALDTCMADGPHLCDRAWVGWAMFGGASMAVVDGVAPPIDQRARWFGNACRTMAPADQACLVMSRRIALGPSAPADDGCKGPMRRMRAALSAAHRAATTKPDAPAP